MAHSDLELRLAWERHVGRTSPAATWFASVTGRYREAHRHYHDIRHVRWVVRHVGDLAADREVADLGAIVVAAFFHDAIYDPTDADNERRSADLAMLALGELGWQPDRAGTVAAMITGTIDHAATGATTDEAILYAADLAVLAAGPSAYSDYVRNVRREYRHVGDADWVTGRSAVLRSFLDRAAIYAPQLSLDSWESRARANLAAELQTLAG